MLSRMAFRRGRYIGLDGRASSMDSGASSLDRFDAGKLRAEANTF